MNDNANTNQIHDEHDNQSKFHAPVFIAFKALMAIITVFCIILVYHYYMQNKLNHFNRNMNKLEDRLTQAELGNIQDLTVRQLAEKLDYVMNQQEVTLAASQEMVDYMSFNFTIIGVFFLLVSGYFVYRQHRSENREDEGWVLAKQLLELVTQSQQFVVQVQKELDKQQKIQEKRQKQIKVQLEKTIKFLNDRANALLGQFARDTISKGIHFTRLIDISNRIDNTKFQLQTYGLSFNQNCYFLKTVYEYIIGNYNVAREEFTKLITQKENRILTNTEKKQLSLCFYYRGLIEYNIQEHPVSAENDINSAIENDPEINGPDYKSRLLKAEIQFKLKKNTAFEIFSDVKKRLKSEDILTETQNKLLSYANLGMAYCTILKGGIKFLPEYYECIKRLDNSVFLKAINWISESMDNHIYNFVTMGQLAVIFEEAGMNFEIESSRWYFEKTYTLIEKTKRYVIKEEPRSKILAYSTKLICEKSLGNPALEYTKFNLRELLNDSELKTIYSCFSKVNVSRIEFKEELKTFLGEAL